MGVRIYEVGISYSGRTYSEGKKIGWADGVQALACIVRIRPWGPDSAVAVRSRHGATCTVRPVAMCLVTMLRWNT
jgi:hypothetical protein